VEIYTPRVVFGGKVIDSCWFLMNSISLD